MRASCDFRGATGSRHSGGGGRQTGRVTLSTITAVKSVISDGDQGTLHILCSKPDHSLLTTDGCLFIYGHRPTQRSENISFSLYPS